MTATTPERFDAEAVLQTLSTFQRDTVEHVIDRLYRSGRSRRFLVADETGLGKSVVARGVIARTVEHLQDDDTVDRIDVVYVCSNADIARQNLKRLDITGQPHVRFASRLTLLAKAAAALGNGSPRAGRSAPGGAALPKPVNLISFTPGTSFEMGWHTGTAEERALLYLLLADELDLVRGWRRRGALNLLRWSVGSVEGFQQYIDWLEHELAGPIDPRIRAGFLAGARREGLIEKLGSLVEDLGRRPTLPEQLWQETRRVIQGLRGCLARAGVATLEPDLIILDEFQRFRDLLDPGTESGELAHHLFTYPQARVLLLSATPYKPFTYAEEQQTDDHHGDFLRTLRFLADGVPDVDTSRIEADLAAYRGRVVAGQDVHDLAAGLRRQLLTVMCRQERPDATTLGLAAEHGDPASDLTPGDLVGYAGLRTLARHLDAPVTVEYWKSSPYFLNFSDGYRFGTRLREELKDPDTAADLTPLLGTVPTLDADGLRHFGPVDLGNARLRRLADETVGAGWWKLLWVPPSLPYLTPGGPFAAEGAATVTKRVIFSSWSAAPSAIASLLSYEASRRIAEGSPLRENTRAARASLARRLTYALDAGRPQAMTTLALFWPSPRLAALADPLAAARRAGSPASAEDAVREIADRLRPELPQTSTSAASSASSWYWAAALSSPGSLPTELRADPERVIAALAGTTTAETPAKTDDDDVDVVHDDGHAGLRAHVDEALQASEDPPVDGVPGDLAETVASLAMHSPANCAWRALRRLTHNQPAVTEAGLWEAAAVLANGLRSLFARWESTLLLEQLLPNDLPYWRTVLTYCGWGNLQAVLDEYLHHLHQDGGSPALDDLQLRELAGTTADAIAVRVSRYEAFDPHHPDRPIPFTSRFALRYGGRRLRQDDVRQPEVRRSFNSPFWPFVLASTSVGQEGIDFHWWCHAIVHWNTPANPVNFEQREGRINRYAGHAVRRNIAERHAAEILADADPNPWRAAYRLATAAHDRCGDFAPHWVYPGPAKIERHLVPYPLSKDGPRYEQLKNDVALYRLTFGQPRQEDMLELLRRSRAGSEGVTPARIDLTPPRRS